MMTKTIVATAAALFAAGTIAVAHAQQAPIKCAGINACKGQSSCKSQLSSSCKGQNACKGQGWSAVKTSLECTAANGRIVL